MSECHFDRMDALIALGARSLIDEEADAFLNLDCSIDVSPKAYRKAARLVRKSEWKEKSQGFLRTVKVAGVACLISVILAGTACASIPPVREAMWNTVIGWYDKYITINFESKDPTQELPEAPSEIEEINLPSYMPNGYTAISEKSLLSFSQEYYDQNGEYVFQFTQWVHDVKIGITVPEQDPIRVDINGVEGILVEDEEVTMVVWRDSRYVYLVQGDYMSQEEILRICRSVRILN